MELNTEVFINVKEDREVHCVLQVIQKVNAKIATRTLSTEENVTVKPSTAGAQSRAPAPQFFSLNGLLAAVEQRVVAGSFQAGEMPHFALERGDFSGKDAQRDYQDGNP